MSNTIAFPSKRHGSITGARFFKPVAREMFVEASALSIIIPEPLPLTAIEDCFNQGCLTLLEFKRGRAYCPRCGVHQRIVE